MAETHEPFSDELISAYLDGELSSSERTLIEQRFQQDPQARHLYEQLRAVRELFQDLPRQTLDEGLCQRVLQRTRNITSATAAAAEISREARPARGVRRGLVWAALAVAAALLLMVVGPREGQDGRQLASAPSAQDDRPAPAAATADSVATGEHASATRKGGDRAPGQARPDAAVPPLTSSAPADSPLPQALPMRDSGLPTGDSNERRSVGEEADEVGRPFFAAPAAAVTSSVVGGISLEGALRVDVTADQLPELVRRLREAQLTRMPAAAADGLARPTLEQTESPVIEDQVQFAGTVAARSANGRIERYIVRASLPDVQTVLRQANVEAVPVALTELDLKDLPRAVEEAGRGASPAAEEGAPLTGGFAGRSAASAPTRRSAEVFRGDAEMRDSDRGTSPAGVELAEPSPSPSAGWTAPAGGVLILLHVIEPPTAPSADPQDAPR